MISATETPRSAARRLAAPAIRDGFQPEALHEYRNTDGAPLYWRIRAKRAVDGEKWIRPMRCNGHGYELKEPEFPKGKKPLYRLDRIAADTSSMLWIMEGEKAVDAATKLGTLATTSGSATSAADADWGAAAGRVCRIWPDNDDAGKAYAGEVANILNALGCRVSCVDIDKLGLPPKGDAWDWLQSHPHATLSDLAQLPVLTPSLTSPNAVAADPEGAPWPGAMDEAALHGIAGEFVHMVEPNTEADPAAILVQFLVAFGTAVGRVPYFRVEGDKHYPNLYAVLVGASSKARKGTSWGRVREVFERLTDSWKPPAKGLSSGEGLIHQVRDPREETKQNKDGALVTAIVDAGVEDKRLLIVEPEFANVLKQAQRAGNILSATIRDGWDSGCLATMTKNDPNRATNAHICIIGHITADELRTELTGTETANGFANRFLFVAARRSKLLPRGGGRLDEAEVQALVSRLANRITLAKTRTHIDMTPNAWAAWDSAYGELSEGHGGLHGAVTARAEAQVIRLALTYALLDGSECIDVPHLLAGTAVWQYCAATAKHVFGASLGDRTADEIARRLERAAESGLTRTEISDAFKRHRSADQIGVALELLRRKGRATCEAVKTDGRSIELWRAAK